MESEEVFFLPGAQAQSGITLQLAGITHPNPRYRMRRQFGADYYVVECITGGRGTLRWPGGSCHPGAGDVYVICPGTPCEYFSAQSEPWEKIWFNIQGPLLNFLSNLFVFRGVNYFAGAGMLDEFARALEVVRRKEADAAHRLALAMHDIFYRLHAFHSRREAPSETMDDAARIREYLDGSWPQGYSQEQCSAVISRSPSQMQRIFRSRYGISPGQYVQRKRLEFALQYLKNSRTTIRQLAVELGFRDEYYFATWFKKHTGYAPKSHPDAMKG